MEMMDYIILGALFIFVFILFILLRANGMLKKENEKLRELLYIKEKMIANLEDSRATAKDVMDNLSSHKEAMSLLGEGESKEVVSEKLGIPLNKLELIVKFDTIKKEKQFGV
ncbi:MAG: hypothetical protein QG567_1355 [Campylobacterota bacterium]|nr:hypothetical protein [Campylobacterota bacterium]